MVATMHANNASSAINKFLGVYSEHEIPLKAAQLAECLIAIVSQTLVPTTTEDGESRAVLAYEILVNTAQVQKQISDRNTEKIKQLLSMDETMSSRLKSNTLNSCLLDLVKMKRISALDAVNYSYDPEGLQREISKLPK